MEELIVKAVRLVHIAAGFTALVIAPLAMIARKGGDAHRRWGKIFFYAMAVVTVTAIIIGIIRPNVFLAMVAVFSFHMIASGYRALYHKRLHEGQRPGRWDIILQASAGVINGGLFIWGITNIMLGNRNSATILFLVFGMIGSLMVWRNLQRFFKRSHEKQEWLFAHMTGFLGGYIATVSAFSAVNMVFIKPVWLQWLWPTILGAPLIALWVNYYRKKFTRGRRARDVVEVRIR
ncbi:MAG: hypothetical protein JNL43_03190 [Flavobacteriales bacterium]|nr:hypothetical protein [Flavobacteriales bacterium]